MDFASTFKSEVFRPIAVLIVPGAIASFPFFMLATKYFPDLGIYRDDHEVPYYAISFLVVLAVGLLLEDVGSVIEANLWDEILEREHQVEEVWDKYLVLTFDKEPIGQRYLRTVLLRLKFELGCAVAFPPFLIGMAWLNVAFPLMSWCGYAALAFTASVIATYLLWESFRGLECLQRRESPLYPYTEKNRRADADWRSTCHRVRVSPYRLRLTNRRQLIIGSKTLAMHTVHVQVEHLRLTPNRPVHD